MFPISFLPRHLLQSNPIPYHIFQSLKISFNPSVTYQEAGTNTKDLHAELRIVQRLAADMFQQAATNAKDAGVAAGS